MCIRDRYYDPDSEVGAVLLASGDDDYVDVERVNALFELLLDSGVVTTDAPTAND